MTNSAYDQHDAAFRNVSAYVVLKDGARVATIALKFPKDGAGRLYAYVHWIGVPMVRGFASGYGYDKRTAAVVNAQRNIMAREEQDRAALATPEFAAFAKALETDGGEYFDRKLEQAGFTVLQAI